MLNLDLAIARCFLGSASIAGICSRGSLIWRYPAAATKAQATANASASRINSSLPGRINRCQRNHAAGRRLTRIHGRRRGLAVKCRGRTGAGGGERNAGYPAFRLASGHPPALRLSFTCRFSSVVCRCRTALIAALGIAGVRERVRR